MMAKEELGLEDWFPPLDPYNLKYEVGMVFACVTLRLSLIKGINVGHLKWDRTKKSQKAWSNIYGSRLLGMGDTIFAKDGEKFMETACPTWRPWFGNFMRISKLRK